VVVLAGGEATKPRVARLALADELVDVQTSGCGAALAVWIPGALCPPQPRLSSDFGAVAPVLATECFRPMNPSVAVSACTSGTLPSERCDMLPAAIPRLRLAAERAFEQGAAVQETGLHGRRFVAAGYVEHADGTSERELVIVGYRLSLDFHRQVEFPSYLCALFVHADDEHEQRSVKGALDDLALGVTPTSPAYAWATRYGLPTDTDCSEATRDANGTLVGVNGAWRLRQTAAGVAFVADRWGASGEAKLVFAAEHELTQPAPSAPEAP